MIANETTLHKRPNDSKINNEQSPYAKVICKRPRIDKCITIQTRKLTA